MADAASANSSAFLKALRPGLPAPAAKFTGHPKYNFVGGNNAPEGVPVAELDAALHRAIEKEGRALAFYNVSHGPLGYRPLREFLSQRLEDAAGMTADPDEILLVSGSLQGMDLINNALLSRGDTVVIEADNYGGVFSRLAAMGVTAVPVALDGGGMRMDALREVMAGLKAKGVTPKYIYTIPTVQNPTATILDEGRRRDMLAIASEYDVPIFEDDCYADLVFDGGRPRAIHALDTEGRVVYLGSFSKSIAPALRVGYVAAPWPLLSRLVALKTDAGSAAIEQIMLAEFCSSHFARHVDHMNALLKDKRDTLVSALAEQFGTAAEFEVPKGGIFLWVRLPESVDTTKLFQAASKAGVAINPGAEWSIGPENRRHIRICYASPSKQELRDGIAELADICFEEFGVPVRGGNRERQ